ncbi:MAG: hypothetical protein U1F43_33475 [Myxococcota bacterium]
MEQGESGAEPRPSMSGGRWLGLLLAAAAVVACTTVTLPSITDADVERAREVSPEISRASLERGRSLYRTRCSTCHEPFLPVTRDAEAWTHVLAEMAPRARLDDGERALVFAYLATFARGAAD